jgi:hypothetical protein
MWRRIRKGKIMTIRWTNKMDGNVGEITEGDEGKKGGER